MNFHSLVALFFSDDTEWFKQSIQLKYIAKDIGMLMYKLRLVNKMFLSLANKLQ